MKGSLGKAAAVSTWIVLALSLAVAPPVQGATQEEEASAQDKATEQQSSVEQVQTTEEGTKTYTLSPEKYEKAVAYSRARNWLYFMSVGWGVVVVLLILFLGISAKYRDWAEGVAGYSFVQALVFVPLLILTMDVLDLPTAIYGQWLSLQYEQSVQSWGSWAWDWTKGELIGLAITIPLIWLLYFVIRKSPRRWWFYFWVTTIPVIVFLVWLAPSITPLFFQLDPLAETQPELVERIGEVVERGGMEIPPERMFEMKASEKLNSVNAYVTGFGTSKRVVVWDTTLEKMTADQTLFVFGHEMGHYVLNHILYGIATALVVIFVFLFIGYRGIHWLVDRCGERWGIRGVDDWASLPALLLVLAVLSFLSSPVTNAVSRYREHQADIYGLEVVHGIVPDSSGVAAEAFQILGEINLSDPDPSEFIRVWRYSHPPVKERIEFASEYDPWSKGEEPQFVK